jgi:hypothetical protein
MNHEEHEGHEVNRSIIGNRTPFVFFVPFVVQSF